MSFFPLPSIQHGSQWDVLASLPQVCGVWRAVPRPSLRLLRAEQLYVALVSPMHPAGEVWGPLLRHRALAAGEHAQGPLTGFLRS